MVQPISVFNSSHSTTPVITVLENGAKAYDIHFFSYIQPHHTQHQLHQHPPSNRIPKPRRPIQNLPLPISLPILPAKHNRINTNHHHHHRITRQPRINPRPIIRRILRAKHQEARDPTNAAGADEGGGAEGAFPVPGDVVGLVGEGGGDGALAGNTHEEGAEVADGGLFGEALGWVG